MEQKVQATMHPGKGQPLATGAKAKDKGQPRTTCEDLKLEDDMLNNFVDDEWFVVRRHLTGLQEDNTVDWEQWDIFPNSMLVPRVLRKPAIGGRSSSSRSCDEWNKRLFYVRSPVALNFPGFVYLIGKNLSGKEVLKA